MSYEGSSATGEQFMLVKARMSDSMAGSIRWLKRVAICVMIVFMLTFFTSAIVLIAEFRPDESATGIIGFLDTMVTVINYMLIIVYVSGSITIFYFLRYMYLDYLLKRA